MSYRYPFQGRTSLVDSWSATSSSAFSDARVRACSPFCQTSGAGANPPIGTFFTYCIVSRKQVIPTPAHVDDVYAAAWTVAGVTAWRYVRPLIISLWIMYYIFVLMTKSRTTVINACVTRGHKVLIRGIGGGVTLLALKLCLALGSRVYVMSCSNCTCRHSQCYRWPCSVNYTHGQYRFSLLQRYKQAGRVLRQGGCIVIFGMTVAPKVPFTMCEVLRNQELIGQNKAALSYCL
jgi:hypothetical protein